jgi:CRP-like cAMP-binding protein
LHTEKNYQANRLLAALPAEILANLDSKTVSLTQGAVIYEPGGLIDRVYFPLSGLISLTILTRNGQFTEAGIVGREGAVGLHGSLGKRRLFTRAVTQIGGTCAVVGASKIEQAANGNGPIRDLISLYTEMLLAETQQLAACNAIHDAGSRLCRWLLQSADRVGCDQLPLTQEFLAQMLGVRRTTVTLLAQALQRGGMIRYGRAHIVLLDRKGLEASACECYKMMHHTKLALTLGANLDRSWPSNDYGALEAAG